MGRSKKQNGDSLEELGGRMFIEVRCGDANLSFTSSLTSFLPGVAKSYSIKEETGPERANDLLTQCHTAGEDPRDLVPGLLHPALPAHPCLRGAWLF